MGRISRTAIGTLLVFAIGSLVSPVFAATYTITVKTDQSSYSGSQSIMINGTVSPAPGANTAVIVTVINPSNATVDIQDDPVNAVTGAYGQVTVAGGSISCAGSPCWTAGRYIVNATWGGDGTTAKLTTTFEYSPTNSTSSTSTSTSISSSSSSKSTTTTTSTTSTTAPPSTSSSTSTATTSSISTTSSFSSTSTTSGGGLGSLTYVLIAVIIVIVLLVGIVMWRRKVASDYAKSSPGR